ncbi:MAG: hypothetical protein AB7L90_14715 [Hyphomicrobiaceae bacterium]
MLDRTVNFFLVHAAIVLPLVAVLALLVSSTARAVVRLIARVVARLMLIAAVVALAYDGTRILAGGSGLVMTSLWDHWASLSPKTLEAAHKMVSSRLDPSVWDMVLAPALHWPAWLTAIGLSLILGWLGRRRREVRIFVN